MKSVLCSEYDLGTDSMALYWSILTSHKCRPLHWTHQWMWLRPVSATCVQDYTCRPILWPEVAKLHVLTGKTLAMPKLWTCFLVYIFTKITLLSKNLPDDLKTTFFYPSISVFKQLKDEQETPTWLFSFIIDIYHSHDSYHVSKKSRTYIEVV